MLSKLFGSNSRVKILKLFLLNPQKKYYVRQLSRELDLQINSVRRELENLEQIGLLSFIIGKESEGGEDAGGKQDKKFYHANADFLFFDEIKSLILKAQVLHKDDFIDKLKKTGKIKLLVLTGIFTNHRESEIDLFIVGDPDKGKVLKYIKELERELGKEINFTIMDQKEFMYRWEITDVFLYGILGGKKIVAIDEIGLV